MKLTMFPQPQAKRYGKDVKQDCGFKEELESGVHAFGMLSRIAGLRLFLANAGFKFQRP